ncbi:O-methyltransferase [Streptosporangium sp. NPDC050855]|uniref:O-methyltransferase n=1 Tax=Streptosporangium sp. NPDC050855 TaxID=3366194 RepID=UPI0037B4AB05
MSIGGTAAYDGLAGVPPLVRRAVEVAREAGFGPSCRPEQGRLLHAPAAGAEVIGETGTGCGVGLAWLVSGARPGTRVVSVERDARWAATAARIFHDHPRVVVLHGDWREIHRDGPYDLLVLDGGGQGKGGEPPADPHLLLRPGGTLVVDDLTPARHWPPRFGDVVDRARMHWLDHSGLDAAELRLAPDLATLVATRRFPDASGDGPIPERGVRGGDRHPPRG